MIHLKELQAENFAQLAEVEAQPKYLEQSQTILITLIENLIK